MENNEYLTYEQAAVIAGVTRRTIENWIARGHISRVNVAGKPRVSRSELDIYLTPIVIVAAPKPNTSNG